MIRVAQNTGNCELILFNDCSPDDSQTIIDEYVSRYPGIVRAMKSERNLGVGCARTQMCQNALGRYVLSFDQDDIMLPFDLGAVISMLDKNTEYSASYARKFLFNEHGLTGEVHGGPFSQFNAFFTPKCNINAMVIRADELKKHRYFEPVANSRINDDIYLMFRLAADTELHFDAVEPRALYRVHDKQNSKLFDADAQEPFYWMGQQMQSLNPGLYNQIVSCSYPKVTDENRKLYVSYLGLAMFLNQRDNLFAQKLIRKALEIAPDDYGVWEHHIIFSITYRNLRDVENAYHEAMEHCHQNDYTHFAYLSAKDQCLYKLNKELSLQEKKDYIDLTKRLSSPPKIVLDNLPCSPH